MLVASWPSIARALHSFPTRRSSDLSVTMPSTMNSVALGAAISRTRQVRSTPKKVVWAWLAARFNNLRSEEHTSELQSRFDLVCRLLLEKKKSAPGQAPLAVAAEHRQ